MCPQAGSLPRWFHQAGEQLKPVLAEVGMELQQLSGYDSLSVEHQPLALQACAGNPPPEPILNLELAKSTPKKATKRKASSAELDEPAGEQVNAVADKTPKLKRTKSMAPDKTELVRPAVNAMHAEPAGIKRIAVGCGRWICAHQTSVLERGRDPRQGKESLTSQIF